MEVIVLKIVYFLYFIFHQVSGQLLSDVRCFLTNGQAAAHLFVSEDLKVGDTIGFLSVLGDPSSQGDIKLRLQEHDSPVNFTPNSRNLTLMRPLDKEGIDGPSSVFINVICERKHTLDPNFIIPINIRVTDANDNVPEFINAPYILNISEVTVVGTRVLQGVKAIDADQPGSYSTVQYSILPGPHADIFIFANTLEGTLILRKPLDYEKISNFSVAIRAQDQGYPPQSSATSLFVNIIDADDQNPIFLKNQYKVHVPLQITAKQILRVYPEPIKAKDQDVGLCTPVKYLIQGDILSFLVLDAETANITITRPLKNDELLSSTTLIIKAIQIDNPDRYALATVIVSRNGSIDNDITIEGRTLPIKFILKDYHINVAENTSPGSVLFTISVNKNDTNLIFWLTGGSEDLEKFSITNSGEIILKNNLDYEYTIQYSFIAHVTDKYNNDTTRINVSVEDINEWEPRFRYPRYEFYVRTYREGSIVGRVEVADGDRDGIFLSLKGPDSRFFEIRNNGELILRFMDLLNGTIARLVVIASDTGKPPRSSMIPVIVHLPNMRLANTASKLTPVWLGNSVFIVAVFGAILGLLGVIILILILYIYKHRKPKNTKTIKCTRRNKENSTVPSALNPTPRILGANILHDTLEVLGNEYCEQNDIDNPVFGEDNDSYSATIKSIISSRQIPNYSKYKIASEIEPQANVDGFVPSNINTMETSSQNSSNFSGDLPDSLTSTWPYKLISKTIKTLSWNDENKVMDQLEITIQPRLNSNQVNNEHTNLTVYF